MRICELCGRPADHRHHVFGASNRDKSEQYGMVAYLCHRCHTNSNMAVHRCRKTDLMLKIRYQEKFEAENPDKSFIEIFGRNYK